MVLPDLFAREPVKRGDLTCVLPELTTRFFDIQLVYQPTDPHNSRLQIFIDHAPQALISVA